MKSLPTGTVTLLFTDIERSTHVLQQLGDRYAEVLATHHRLLRAAIEEAQGHVVDTAGDAVFAVFSRARDALRAAVASQRAVLAHSWPDGIAPKVRMGLHTGEPSPGETGYVGMDVHRAARIAAAGHGGQILMSSVIHGLVANDLPDGVSLRDLGEHRLKDLTHPDRLFQVVATHLPVDFPPIRSLDVLPNNLPRQLTSFIGRENEIAEVKRLLSTAYLVTLTGSGGAGKTRLALRVAADVAGDYPDGVWLAEFAPIADPALVPRTVASALNLPEYPGRDMTEALIEAFRPKTVLLVLDNCEHLLAGCRDLAAALLRKCSHVRILATSRESLGVPGETIWRIPSLSLPEDVRHLPPSDELGHFDAVRLFVDRAVAIASSFTVTNDNAPAVAEVCRRLDGIPLAIELAAARVKVLAVEQIAARLDDRFRLLAGGSRALLPRHQTLRATMDWSYDLLSEQERTVLRRLSVFAGGWTLEAAEYLCAGGNVDAVDILDLLTSLVDKSLVVAETRRGEVRYRLLESIRQYALERLVHSEEVRDVRRRHRDWYLEVAESAAPKLRGPEQVMCLDQLEIERDNLRVALEWSRAEQGGVEAWLRLAAALQEFWYMRGYLSEGREWFEAALAANQDPPPAVQAKARCGAGLLAWRQGDFRLAERHLQDALGLFRELRDQPGTANALHYMAHVALRQGDYKRGRRLFEDSLSLFKEAGDRWGEGWSLCCLCRAMFDQGDDRAVGLLEESVSLCRETGNTWALSYALHALGEEAERNGDFGRATVLLDESVVLARQVGDKYHFPGLQYRLAHVLLLQGNNERSAALFRESLALRRETGDKPGFTQCLEGLAGVAVAQGFYLHAARLLGAAETVRQTLGVPRRPVDCAEFESLMESVQAALKQVAFAAAWAEGRALTLEQAIEYALADERAVEYVLGGA